MKKKFFTKKRLKKGATTMIEIILIIVVLVIVCVGAFSRLGGKMTEKVDGITEELSDANTSIWGENGSATGG